MLYQKGMTGVSLLPDSKVHEQLCTFYGIHPCYIPRPRDRDMKLFARSLLGP
jgi:hypothetical protein